MRLILAHRTVDLDGPPLAMAIVNVTPDSFYDGGVSATPEQAVATGAGDARRGRCDRRRRRDDGPARRRARRGRGGRPGRAHGVRDPRRRTRRRDLGGHLPRRGRCGRTGRRSRRGQRPHRRCRSGTGQGRSPSAAPDWSSRTSGCGPSRCRTDATRSPSTRSPSHCSSAPPPPRRPACGATRSCSTPASASASRPPPTWPACGHLDRLTRLGYPLLLASSHKEVTAEPLGLPEANLEGTAAVVAVAAAAGVRVLRVHDLPFMERVARMAWLASPLAER